jgi:hypothetical protein|tara:strand:- start:3370 stop:3789 length:420 start_codon:yes stop_codon:yes gene_type:complete
MIVLIIITIILIITFFVGSFHESDNLMLISFICLVTHVVVGWGFFGSLAIVSESTSFYDVESSELRHFSYGNAICFHIIYEEGDLTFLSHNLKDNRIFKKGDWIVSVTRNYNSYSALISEEFEIMSKTDGLEHKIAPKN